jgi:hypothetical protein
MQGTAVAAISNAKSLTISRAMSAPSIDAHGDAVTGHGIAIVGVSVEQDSAYWEAHIDLGDGAEPVEVMFGVSLKKDRSFFKALENVPAGKNSVALESQLLDFSLQTHMVTSPVPCFRQFNKPRKEQNSCGK